MKRPSMRVFPKDYQPSLREFEQLVSQSLSRDSYSFSADVVSNIPIYDAKQIDISDPEVQTKVMDEFYDILSATSGVFVLKNMYPSTTLLDQVNKVFEKIIESERTNARGDHFATGGKNDRIWNSFEKHAMRDTASFYKYYSNAWLSVISRAWLGPGYKLTAQVNVVKPSGAAQMPHRDYHIGFQDLESAAKIPLAMHRASPYLTLQGGIAHCDMPLDSGPTRLLPFSQGFEAGFIAYRLPEFAEFFAERYVCLPLKKGDAIFFNPALFHAAGANETASLNRTANLIQVSSPFGKPMEQINTLSIIDRCWDHLHEQYQAKGFTLEVEAFVAAIGEGYPFPTNLDARPPGPSGMAPESEQDILKRGLQLGWQREKVTAEITNMRRI